MSSNNKNETDLRRLRAVDRAIADLRRGLSIIVTGPEETSLVLATEMAFDAELETLAERSGATPVLALTAHRANVLHIQPTGDDAVRVVIEDWMDAPLMRALADAVHDLDQPFRGPFTRIKESVPPTIPAAIKLAKLGRLLPSVLAAPLSPAKVTDLQNDFDLSVVSLDDILAFEEVAALQLKRVASAKVPSAHRARAILFSHGSIRNVLPVISLAPSNAIAGNSCAARSRPSGKRAAASSCISHRKAAVSA